MMLCETPTKFFMAIGNSEGYTELNSFDGALLNAGIGNTNLVKMSSIVPPYCQEIDPIQLPYGALVPVAYAAITSDMAGEIISAAVAAAFPKDTTKPGLIMEYSSRGHREDVEKIVRQMALKGMEEMRGEKVTEIKSVAIQHEVKRIGTAFASIVLWY